MPTPSKPGSAASGLVLIKLPGSHRIVPLTGASSIPVGATIDTRTRAVTLASAVDHAGTPQAATFFGGIFTVRQHSNGVTDIYPAGGHFSGCHSSPATGSTAQSAAHSHSHGRIIRQLWSADNHGQFRTHGRNSVATVRGTAWVTVERCDGTTTYVLAGEVAVRDLHLHKTVLVRAGHEYFARASH
jgi:hypothetical protein